MAFGQESFQLESETWGCYVQTTKQVVRWDLHGDRYTSKDSSVILSSQEVDLFRKSLIALPDLDQSGSFFPGADQLDPTVRALARRKLTSDFGLRQDLRDLDCGLNAEPMKTLQKNVVWFAGSEWKLSFSGSSAFKLTGSGVYEPLPMFTLDQDSLHRSVFSFAAVDFFRVLGGRQPGAELDFYLAGDRGRWDALKQLQDQPRFADWENTFRLGDVSSSLSPKFDLELVPRLPNLLTRLSWRTNELDCQVGLARYNQCLLQLDGRSWLKHWKSASAGRSISVSLGDPAVPTYHTDSWAKAGLPGQATFELNMRGPDGQSAQVLIGDETDVSLVVSSEPSHHPTAHWLDKMRLTYSQTILISSKGDWTRPHRITGANP